MMYKELQIPSRTISVAYNQNSVLLLCHTLPVLAKG